MRQTSNGVNHNFAETPKWPKGYSGLGFFLIALVAIIFFKQKLAPLATSVSSQINPQAAYGSTASPALASLPRRFWDNVKTFVFNPEKMLKGEAENRINILLLGIGGKGHNGPDLTDTIILLSIQPSTNQLALISIPRDLSVPIPGFDWRKINSANAYGEARAPGAGPKLSAQIVENVFGLPIHYYARLDFEAFKKIVDELGGVRINVDRAFTDQAYPTPDDKITALTFASGWQTLDGERAIAYARSRHGDNGEGNDFARSKRQQKLLLALKERLFSLGVLANPNSLLTIASIIKEHLATNIGLWEIQNFFKLARKIDYETTVTRVLDDSPGGLLMLTKINGASILEPRGDSFLPLQELVKNIFNESAESAVTKKPVVARPAIEIQNGTWTLGLTAKIKKNLEEAGLNIEHITTASSRTVNDTVIYDLSRGAYRETVVKIQGLLQAIATTAPPPEPLKAETTADILIIVGKDRSS